MDKFPYFDLDQLGEDLRKALQKQTVANIQVVVVPERGAVYVSANHSVFGKDVQLGIEVRVSRR